MNDHIRLPEEDIHRPLQQVGFIHASQAGTTSTSSALSPIDTSEFAPRHLFYRRQAAIIQGELRRKNEVILYDWPIFPTLISDTCNSFC